MEWARPILLERKFTTYAGKKIIARVGFPRSSEKADNEWACDFQLVGRKYDRLHVAHGVDGLQALTIAAEAIRKALDCTKGVMPTDPPFEFDFPRYVPISYGLKFHRHLWKLLDAEIKKKERQLRAVNNPRLYTRANLQTLRR